MLGDTASLGQYTDNTEYGKGLYIYHVDPDGVRFPPEDPAIYPKDISPQDMECADGYWEWEFQGRGAVNLVYDCFVSGNNWKIYKKKNILYTNDPSLITNYNPYGDEISFHHRISDTTWPCWWGIGKQPISACYMGTDRSLVNEEDIYTKNGLTGDRWDAWKPEYNEVFSPYSSPSTRKWNDAESGIFIWYNSSSGYTANINIYKVGENNITEDQILAATPPSRPMGLKLDVTECIDSKVYPILTWNHNMEPDMLQTPGNILKRYKIYRAYDGINSVPGNYTEIYDGTFDKDTPPSYIDYDTYANCFPTLQDVFRIRYKIKAVDITPLTSVYSDFVSIATQDLNRGGGDNFVLNSSTPKEFILSQNYPNPFNPMTKINFALPRQGFVTLKIYDITGREIQTLVNDVKQAGYYSIDFNGSALSSGVYFYMIKSGDFVMTKRMVLIK